MQVCRSAVLPQDRLILFICTLAMLCAFPAYAQDVATYHNNHARTGLNPSENILTLTNVNSASFGKLFTIPVDGKVDAEPLYLSAVPVNGVFTTCSSSPPSTAAFTPSTPPPALRSGRSPLSPPAKPPPMHAAATR
jgi:hypothetical protein